MQISNNKYHNISSSNSNTYFGCVWVGIHASGLFIFCNYVLADSQNRIFKQWLELLINGLWLLGGFPDGLQCSNAPLDIA